MLLGDLSVRKECDAFRQKQLFFALENHAEILSPEASEASARRHYPVAGHIVVRAKTHRLPNGSRGAAIDGACDHGIACDFAGRNAPRCRVNAFLEVGRLFRFLRQAFAE